MGIFGGSSMDEGVEEFRATPGAVLLDVRTPGEFSGGHVPGAVNLPLDVVDTIDIPKTTPLFVYCRSGARSAQATSVLKSLGYAAKNIGGIMDYSGEQE